MALKACCSLYYGFQYGRDWLNIEQPHVHGACNWHFGCLVPCFQHLQRDARVQK